jgi:hypothetical protein
MTPMAERWTGVVLPRVLAVLVLLGVASGARAEPGSEVFQPPGDCSKEVFRELNQAVGVACKSQPMRCDEAMDCPALLARWGQFNRCIQTRKTLMERCFRGGDSDHKSKLADYVRGQSRCLELIQKKCRVDGQCK